MTVTIELTEAEQVRITALAEKSGTDVESVVHSLLCRDEPVAQKPNLTPKQLWDELEAEGIIGPPWGEEMDAPELAR